MNPKVRWGVWVKNHIEDNCPPQLFGQGHPDYIYPYRMQAEAKALNLAIYFGFHRYLARKYVKRS